MEGDPAGVDGRGRSETIIVRAKHARAGQLSGRALLGSHSDLVQQDVCRKGAREKAAVAGHVRGAQMPNPARGYYQPD